LSLSFFIGTFSNDEGYKVAAVQRTKPHVEAVIEGFVAAGANGLNWRQGLDLRTQLDWSASSPGMTMNLRVHSLRV
jgi:hypothetical protein